MTAGNFPHANALQSAVVAGASSSFRFFDSPALENFIIGFRLASVPEPSSVLKAGLGGLALLTRRRRPDL
jgi:hypothetical protein